MNKNCYRVIFNNTRGIMMVVAETVVGRPKADGTSRIGSIAPSIWAGLRPITVSLLSALGLIWLTPSAHAQVVADPNAPANQRPTVDAAANGVPLVNIRTPSAAGVSRNAYQQFDVQQPGVILNNARTNTQTQLGGWVQGNPNLAGGAARVILNEVNSSNPSLLRGYVEVAGNRAQVVIANPAGISCEGCGFINADRSTLTTGTPVFGSGGGLEGFRVEGGTITISGAGLDATASDYTDLIARSVLVNAGIWANQLKVTVGMNQVDPTNTHATPIAGSGAAPAFAIDVAHLGGMYAGKIMLVGTEAGVGMRNAGTIGAAAGDVVLTVDGRLENSGALSAAAGVRLDAAALAHTGTMAADSDISIRLASDYVHTNTIQAEGHLTLQTTGDVVNQSGLLAGQTLSLDAAHLDNTATGEIAAYTTRLTTNTLTNRGLIDGVQTIAETDTLHNLDGGSIYGDHLAIDADQLRNEAGAVIAARDRLDIGARTVDNRSDALLFSAGEVAIAGALDGHHNANGSADAVVNAGATIEALGNLDIDAQTIHNLNAGITTTDVIVDVTDYDQFTPRYESVMLNSADYPEAQIGNFNISGRTAGPYSFREYWRYLYTGTTTETQLLSSLPGQILAGNDLRLNGDVTNSDSRIIAGNALTITGGALNNLNTAGNRITTYSGTAHYYDYDGNESCSDPVDGCYDISTHVYNPANTVITFNLPTTTLTAHTAPTGSGTTLSDAAIPAQGGGLFGVNPDPAGTYLIETDTRFASYREWLSSDYMLQQLALDPTVAQKRLGDGFYEQRLIREQVAQLTGRRFLDGHANDETQYQVLMNAGLTHATALQLIPGVALSAEQIAQLTSDIVWLVEREVTLSDGTQARALVPQVYLQLKPGDLEPTTGLLAGNTVDIRVAGDITNGGTIAGRELLTLDAENIRNLGGALSGDIVILDAAQNIENIGGTVIARDTLIAEAGNDIIVRSTTQSSEQRYGASRFTRTNLDRVAGLYVTGDSGLLLVSAGRDVTLDAAVVANRGVSGETMRDAAAPMNSAATGLTVIEAGRDIHLGTVTIAEQNNSVRDSRNFLKHGGTQEVGSTIDVAGDIALNAGQDVRTRAAIVHSEAGAIEVSAARDISIEAGRETMNFDAARRVKRSGTFSSTTSTYRDTHQSDTSLGSSLSGETVSMQAGRDIGVEGSNVVSTEGTALLAGRDITIEAATDTYAESHFKKQKRSGFSASTNGGLSVGYGKSSAEGNAAFSGSTASASTIGSAEGDVIIGAGRNATVRGSDVVAGEDIRLAAEQVDIETAAQAHDGDQRHKSKQSGISVGIVGTPFDTFRNLKEASRAEGMTSKIDQIGHEIAASALTVPQIAINIGSSKSQSSLTEHETTQRGSTLAAGGDILISASGSDITVTGSTLTAEGAARLHAQRNIVLQASTDTYEANSNVKHRESSFSTAIASPGDTIRHLTGGPNNSGVKSFPYGQHTAKDTGNSSATYQNPTLISANAVVLDSNAGDIAVIGSGVRATQDLTLLARQGNIDVRSGQESSRHHEKHESRTIGDLGSNAHNGVTGNSNAIGVRKTKSELNAEQTLESTVRSSLVAGRDLTLEAEQDIGIHGADLAAGRDMDVTGRRVTIDLGQDATRTAQRSSMDQFGITASVNSPILSAVQAAQQMERASQRTDDSRMRALAATTAAISASNAYHAVQSNPAQAGGISGSLTVGAVSTDHRSEQFRQDYSGSTMHAGRDMTVTAQGGGEASDIKVVGSDLQAGRDLTLRAEDEIELLAAKKRFTQESNSSGSSWGVGVAAQYGANGFAMGIMANASGHRGDEDGEAVRHINTHVTAGNVLTVESSGDTNLKGAVASGKQVIVDVGGDLNIESLQDTETYDARHRNVGGSVTLGYGFAASANYGKTDIKSTYASVVEQSGIKAGDEGFQVNVAGNTDLKGALIASTDKAVEDDKNRLTTGTLTTSDIENRAKYEASSVSIGLGYSPSGTGVGIDQQGQAQTGGAQVPGTTLPSLDGVSATPPIAMSASDEIKSTTPSGVSSGEITITDEAKQQEHTGQDADTTIATLNRDVASDKDTSNSLKSIFDKEQIDAGFDIVGAFTREIGTYINNRIQEADSKRALADEVERKANDLNNGLSDEQRQTMRDQVIALRNDAEQISGDWGAGGKYRQFATALVAAAGGNVTGTNAQFAQNMVVNYVQQEGAGYIGNLVAQGLLAEGSPEHAALHAIVACAGAAASNQSCGAAALGAVTSSLLTGLFAEASPDETDGQREAKRNLIASLATGIAAAVDANQSTATQSAIAAVDNNWLATQQTVQMNKELEAATSLLEQAQILAKWRYISVKQDTLTGAGIGKGLAEAGWGDIKGLAQFLMNPVEGLSGLKELISSEQARQELGDTLFRELDAKIDRMSEALQHGGDAHAEQFGRDLGNLIWQVGATVTGAGGVAKGGVALARVGVNVSTNTLETLTKITTKLDTGAIHRFKSADEINALMKGAEWSPAWKPGTAVAETNLKPGTRVKMVVGEDEFRALTDPTGKADISRSFGGWATFDDVPNQAYARSVLAITEGMKKDVGYVIEIEIVQAVNAHVGIVGAQGPAIAGGGNQLHFIIPPGERINVFKYVPESGRSLQ